MKKIIYFWIILVGLASCQEEERGQYATDDVPPGKVKDVRVVNVPGGAIITYTIPSDDDLLYVKVLYTMPDGSTDERESSVYSNELRIEGLARAKKQTVKLICGDRSGNESEPVLQEIEPLDSPIYSILESVQMSNDFGGIKTTWENPTGQDVILTFYVQDTLSNQMVELQSAYTNSKAGKFNIRGYPPKEQVFGLLVRDRYENKTEMISGTFLPRFEEQIDPSKFSKWNPPGIPYSEIGGWGIANIWNGLLADNGFSFPTTNRLPNSATFDMGQTALINRIKWYQRMSSSQAWAGYNTSKFQLWGSPTSSVTDDFATWIYLGEYDLVATKPSGSPLGTVTQEDTDFAAVGIDLQVEVNNNVPVRYIRIHFMETFSGGMNVAQLWEIELFGQIVK
ncbi:MAG: DUF4959 domain-containing protein [Mangrovibacterium sp.]